MYRDIHIFVFSYNRAVFLDNCLKSIRDCAAHCKVTIIDDHSSDLSTLEVIDKWREFHDVYMPVKSKEAYKTGGLYNNMNQAMILANEKGLKYALFIQDDMQFIRKLKESDIQDIHVFYSKNKNVVQYDTNFMKFDSTPNSLYLDQSGKGYLKSLDFHYSGFTALGVFHVERFFNLFGEFKSSERQNDMYARTKGVQRGYARNPFMMWLPNPVSHRGKKRTLKLKITEKLSGAGYYPYHYMSDSEASYFRKRKHDEYPIARHYLNCTGLSNNKQWAFVGGTSALYEQGGWKRTAGRFLSKLGF